MSFLLDLWLPILVSGVFVFLVSSVFHMVISHHQGDHGQLPAEDALLDAMRQHGVKPGAYVFPWAGCMSEANSPQMKKKYEDGPVGFMTVLPEMAMMKSLLQWFLYTLLVGLFVAYLAHLSFEKGAEYLKVFRMTGTAAFMGYGLGAIADSIWKGVSWKVTMKFLLDGLAYALVTAGTFAWLWPAA